MELDFINENAWYITSFVEPRVEDLYRKVEDYVRRNYIYNYVFEDGFLVGYKNEGYELKRVFGPCVLYSLAKLGDYSPDYIDLERVMSDELTQKEQEVKNRIDQINYDIEELVYEGVPRSLIRRAIKKRLIKLILFYCIKKLLNE